MPRETTSVIVDFQGGFQKESDITEARKYILTIPENGINVNR